MLPIAETEVIGQYSDPLHELVSWCLPHVYSLWAESEHATRLVHVQEANGQRGGVEVVDCRTVVEL